MRPGETRLGYVEKGEIKSYLVTGNDKVERVLAVSAFI